MGREGGKQGGVAAFFCMLQTCTGLAVLSYTGASVDALTGERHSKVGASHLQGGEKTPGEAEQKAKRSFKPLPVDTQLLTAIPESEPGSAGW